MKHGDNILARHTVALEGYQLNDGYETRLFLKMSSRPNVQTKYERYIRQVYFLREFKFDYANSI